MVPLPAEVLRLTASAVHGLPAHSLTLGGVVHARLERAPDGVGVSVFIGRHRLAATVSGDLPTWGAVSLRVVATEPRIVLALDSPQLRSSPDDIILRVLADRGLPADTTNRLIVSYLIGLGHSATRSQILRAAHLVRRARDRSSTRVGVHNADRGRSAPTARASIDERVRLATLLEDRFPEETGDALMTALLAGHHDAVNDEADSRNRRGQKASESETSSIGAVLTRAVNEADHPLQLLNALAGAGDLHWVVVPIGATYVAQKSAETPSASADATLSVAISRATAAPVAARLDARRSDWDGGQGTVRVRWQRGRQQWDLVGAEVVLDDGRTVSAPDALLARLGLPRHTGDITGDGAPAADVGGLWVRTVDQYG